MVTEEKVAFIESVILSQKMVHRGLVFKLLKEGGEITMDDPKRGIRIVVQGDFINIQYVAHNQQPTFKTQVYKTMAQQKAKFDELKDKQKEIISNIKKEQTTLNSTIKEGGELW
jgi:predicted metal-dependent RNase